MRIKKILVIVFFFAFVGCAESNKKIKSDSFFTKGNVETQLQIKGCKDQPDFYVTVIDSVSEYINGEWYNKLELKGLFFSPTYYINYNESKNKLTVLYYSFENSRNSLFSLNLNNINTGDRISLPSEFSSDYLANNSLKLLKKEFDTDLDDHIYLLEASNHLYGYCCLIFHVSPKHGVVKIECLGNYFIKRHI
jgi:hypothetical protein